MADNSSSGAVGILGVLIGAMIVAAVGFFVVTGGFGNSGTKSVDISLTPPAVLPK